MKKILSFSVVALFMVILATDAVGAGYKKINEAELHSMMSDGSELVIIDVREADLYNAGHIPGAVNIPYDGTIKVEMNKYEKDTRIVYVCHTGPMGDQLAAYLIGEGYTEVYNLIGGMRSGWKGERVK